MATSSSVFERPTELDVLAQAERIERLSVLLDSSIRLPIIGYRIGVDGLVGLIPGIGDAVGGALSTYLIVEAARAGARKRILARMAGNALVDGALGAVPVVGDVFDFAFKANRRNARLAADELRRIARRPT